MITTTVREEEEEEEKKTTLKKKKRVKEEHECQRVCDVEWFLVADKSHFHVYVVASIAPERESRAWYATPDYHPIGRRRERRIDWDETSVLKFRDYEPRDGETVTWVGRRVGYCKRCIKEKMRVRLREYSLFKFNCRTVSFMILTDIAGLGPREVYEKFAANGTLCGLDDSECLTLESLKQYIAWREERGESWCQTM
jgi:hypothetical protein